MNVVLHGEKKKSGEGKKQNENKKHFFFKMMSAGESAVGEHYFLKGLCGWSQTICIF